MKTSKIKEVVSSKPHANGNIYHNLIMENGDKLNIGKKKQQLVGWELTYEIIDEQSGEFKQSKSVQQNPATTNTGNPMGIFNKDDKPSLNVQNLIVAQSCLSSACTLLQQSQDASSDAVINVAKKFYEFVMSKG